MFPQLEFFIDLDRLFIGRNQQVQDLLPLGGNEMLMAAEVDFHPNLHLLVFAQFDVHQQVFDARQQVALVIGLADEIVRTALQTPDHVLGIGKRSHEDDWNALELIVGFDRLAQLVAVQFRHQNIADDQRGFAPLRRRQGLRAVAGGRDRMALFRQQVLQPCGLRRAVLSNEYVHTAPSPVRGIHGLPPSRFPPLASVVNTSAIFTGVRISFAAPSLIASPGMPYTTELSLS